MSQRTSIFSAPAEQAGVDVSDFAPKPREAGRPAAEEIDRRAGNKFPSREPGDQSARQKNASNEAGSDGSSTKRQPMVYRTGRNVTFSAKTTRATLDRFYFLAEQNGWKAAETFERAVAALEREVDADAG